MKRNLRDIPMSQQAKFIEELGEKPYRLKQIREWIYKGAVTSFDEMTNLSKTFRQRLAEDYSVSGLLISERRESADGTIKYLFALDDGEMVESVYIPGKQRATVCVSTQVGCKFACDFCATGKQGFSRNLNLGEIINQLVTVKDDVGREKHITNIVFMGMGEPLDNMDGLLGAIDVFHSQQGFDFSARRITVSTAGVVSQLQRLADEGQWANLAISLHASNDATRNRLMPINKKWRLAKLMEALRSYPIKPYRKLTFEYILFDGVNDSDDDARELIELLRGIKAKVNLLSFNAVKEAELQPSSHERVNSFWKIIADSGMVVTIRKSRGTDIEAACGQLRSKQCR